MKVKNLMTEELITIDKDQNLSDGLKLFRKHNISRLPVTNVNQENQNMHYFKCGFLQYRTRHNAIFAIFVKK